MPTPSSRVDIDLCSSSDEEAPEEGGTAFVGGDGLVCSATKQGRDVMGRNVPVYSVIAICIISVINRNKNP